MDRNIAWEWERFYRETPPKLLPWEAWEPEPHLKALVETGQVTPGERALDLGCGLGTHSLFLAAQGLRVVGLAISRTALQYAQELARRKSLAVSFVKGNALALPFSSASFSFIFDRGCFHHIPAEGWGEYLAEVGRVLQVGGKLLLISFRHRLTREQLYSLFGRTFQVEGLEASEFRERPTGLRRFFWVAFMRRLSVPVPLPEVEPEPFLLASPGRRRPWT